MGTGATTMTRRGWLARLLLAAAAAPVAGVTLAAPVAAGKKKKSKIGSVADRTVAQQVVCEANGGTLAVLDGPFGGNTTECKGGENDGEVCYNTTKTTQCYSARTQEPTKPGGGSAVPPSGGNEPPANDPPLAGGGTGVDPSGGNEHPSDPGASDGGGSQAGGGAAVGPGDSAEQPGAADGGVVLRSAKPHGPHQRHGHGNQRGR